MTTPLVSWSASFAGVIQLTDTAAPNALRTSPSIPTYRFFTSAWFLWLGVAALALPTILRLAREYWSLEQGGHGPIVLATGAWLIVRTRHRVEAVAQPGSATITALLLVPALLAYVFARIIGMLEIESVALYGICVTLLYYHAGARAVRLLWFPLVYLLFLLPQPETLILPLSHVLKLGLSTAAVWLLAQFGYPVGHGGVVIYVAQYELLVATACSGLNSLIGLGAIGVFYTYLRFDGDWRASWPLLLAIAPIAIIANFVRVVVLILVTYHFGNEIASIYVHDIAGIMLFVLAVLMLLGVDHLVERLRARGMRV